jgi:outer membrane protein OmpA-like peptidoglycan-associated protein
MFTKISILGVTLLLLAAPAASQERGTIEFGGFATGTSFDNSLFMDNSFGAGGLVGVFLMPWLSLEFDGQGSTAARSLGLRDVNVGMVHARLTAVPLKLGRASLLVGVGVNDFDTNFHLSYGMHGLVGAKLSLTDGLDLRIDAIQDRMSMGGGANRSIRAGISLYRHTPASVRVVTREVPGAAMPPMTMQHTDSVSAAETARLRAIEAEHRAMLAAEARAVSDATIMAEVIHFGHDSSELSPEARAILDSKVLIFRSDPEMRILITGYASQPGTEAYNMALGLRRAEATRAYLISRGVAASRVQIATRGQNELVVDGPGERADAANRRGEFRLLVSDPGGI